MAAAAATEANSRLTTAAAVVATAAHPLLPVIPDPGTGAEHQFLGLPGIRGRTPRGGRATRPKEDLDTRPGRRTATLVDPAVHQGHKEDPFLQEGTRLVDLGDHLLHKAVPRGPQEDRRPP